MAKRTTRRKAKASPRQKPSDWAVADCLAWALWDGVSDATRLEACDVDLSRIPIEDIKAARLICLENAREPSAAYKKDGWPSDQEQRDIARAAVWACQIEINKHTAFMRRQLRMPL